MPTTVQFLNDSLNQRWDRFVLAHPQGSPFHLLAWKRTIEETFDYRPHYLLAMEGNAVRGVLPLFLVKNMLIKRALISSPFAVYGGILADSAEAHQALHRLVLRLGAELNVQYVELRNAYPEQCVGFEKISRYVTFTSEVGPDETAGLAALPRKMRYMVRKALKEDFSTGIASDPRVFERLYAESLRRLGTPSFPARYFDCLLRHFQGSADIRETVLEGRTVAAVLSFYFRDQVLPYYGASDPEFNAKAPNNFMYYDLMRSAGRNGCRVFDFGRSKKDSGGSYDFKSHWGMAERSLPYEMLLVKRKTLPNYSPANPVFRVPRLIWQHLPAVVTRTAGPALIRLVP
jgi:FemAB-related protein (PEP-CTERM system-associated)